MTTRETTTQSLILRLIAFIKFTPPFSNLSPAEQLQLLSALLQEIRGRLRRAAPRTSSFSVISRPPEAISGLYVLIQIGVETLGYVLQNFKRIHQH